jgi:outer membrane receptor protein involved in Fe transport
MNARSLRRLAALLALSLAAPTLATRALADDVADEADLQFRLAAERYQAGDFRGALEHFLASNRLAPNRNVLFNIGRCYEALKEFPDAYRYYVRAMQGETDKKTIATLEEALKRMAPNVAILRVTTDPPGATLYLDRKDLGQRGAAPQTIALAPGKYVVIAEAPGYEDAQSAPQEIRAGGATDVSLRLTRILGTVHVVGDDAAGATIRVDSEEATPACVAPCDLQLPPGRHTLYASRAGYKTSVALVDVIARQAVTAHPNIEAKTGSLVVSADEPGAIVSIDGVDRGPTPALLNLPVGAHKVRIALHGFRSIDREVQIEANQEIRLENVPLVPIEEVEAASRTAESVEDAPASVSIVSGQELRGMAYPTVWEALRGVRGVYLSDDRAYPTAGFRGFGRPGDYGNRTLVLLNGQPMNDNWLWASYLGLDQRSDLEDVQRIEVVRGPGSVLYGTGAFSGVINIVTRPHDAPTGYEVGGGAVPDATIGHARARAAWKLGSDGGAWTSAGISHSSGTEFFFHEYAQSTPPSIAGHTPAAVDRLDAMNWTGNLWWKSLNLQWSLNTHTKHLPTGQFNTLVGDDRTRQTDTRGMIEARFEPKVTNDLQSLSRATLNFYDYTGYFAGFVEQGGLSHQTYSGVWSNLEQRFLYNPSPALRVTVGGEFDQHFKADQFGENELFSAPATNGIFLDDHRSFQVGAGYAVVDLTPADPLKLSLGGRYDYYSTFGGSFNPRLAVILRPSDDDNVKVMFGKAFRAPSIYELFYAQPGSQIPSPNLQAESMYSAEVEYSHRFSPTVQGIVSLYDNYITDLISLQAAPGTDPAQQIVEYLNTTTPVGTLGVETELRKEWKDGWMVSANYSHQKSAYLKDSSLGSIVTLAKDPTRREVPNAPEDLASVRAAAPILGRGLLATSRVSFSGPRFDVHDKEGTVAAPTPAQGKTESAVVWDLVMTGAEQRWHLRYSLGIYNVLDWRYTVPVSAEFLQTQMPQPGRTLLANAYVDF